MRRQGFLAPQGLQGILASLLPFMRVRQRPVASDESPVDKATRGRQPSDFRYSGTRLRRSNNENGYRNPHAPRASFSGPISGLEIPKELQEVVAEMRERQSGFDIAACARSRREKQHAKAVRRHTLRNMARIAFMFLFTLPAFAQDFGIRTFATEETLLKSGENRGAVFGARAILKVTVATLGGRAVRVIGRAQASAVPDGEARLGSVSFDNLESFQSLELIGGLEVQAYGDLYIAAFYGTALQIEGGRPQAEAASPKLYGVGPRYSLRFAEEPGWISAGVCVNEAVGSKRVLVYATVQVPLGSLLQGKVAVIGDVYGPGEGSFSRVGVAFQF